MGLRTRWPVSFMIFCKVRTALVDSVRVGTTEHKQNNPSYSWLHFFIYYKPINYSRTKVMLTA